MQDNGLQNLLAITRFRCIEVPFHVFYYYSRVNKIVLYTEDFVILMGDYLSFIQEGSAPTPYPDIYIPVLKKKVHLLFY